LIIGIILVILYISNKLVSPLSTIVLKMKQVGKGDFRTKLDTYEILELDEISVSFNEMTDKISHLIKEVYEAGLLIKEARIKYLQAQINPHFMFNVLSMIAIRLKLNKDEELYKMVQAFAGLMRGKLFRKDEIEIRINEEIEIAEFYLYLSKERFKNKVSYEINWEDEKLKTLFIPDSFSQIKYSLSPTVIFAKHVKYSISSSITFSNSSPTEYMLLPPLFMIFYIIINRNPSINLFC